MLRNVFTCLCLLVQLAAAGQQKEYTLNGFMAIVGGETFSYKVVFTETAGKIEGYSLTYLKAPEETKASITGVIDRVNHKLAFKETGIIYEHGLQANTILCLVDAHLTYNHDSKQNWLTGSITSSDADKNTCAGGTILFSNDDELKKLFASTDELDMEVSMHGKKTEKPEPVMATEEQPALKQPAVTEKVTVGMEKAFDWESDTAVVDIWDGGNVDGDVITILVNSQPVLSNYPIVKQKKRLRIPLHGNDVYTITIVAVNNGQDPPNTATLLLTDGAKQYSVLAYNEAGNQAIIKIRKVKKPVSR